MISVIAPPEALPANPSTGSGPAHTRLHLAVIILTAIGISAGNFFSMRLDGITYGADAAFSSHLNSVQRAYEAGERQGWDPARLWRDRVATFKHPPLQPIAAAYVFKITDRDYPLAVCLYNGLCLLAAMAAVYGTGAAIQSAGTGLLAALLLAFFPGNFGLMRHFNFTYPLVAACSLAVFGLIKTNAFSSRGWSIITGCFFSSGE